jgi:serine/threonine protein kinase
LKAEPFSGEYEDLRWLIDREIQIMSALDHPHIIHLEEVYEDEERVYFILELAKVRQVKHAR